jgi:hypothetical protein
MRRIGALDGAAERDLRHAVVQHAVTNRVPLGVVGVQECSVRTDKPCAMRLRGAYGGNVGPPGRSPVAPRMAPRCRLTPGQRRESRPGSPMTLARLGVSSPRPDIGSAASSYASIGCEGPSRRVKVDLSAMVEATAFSNSWCYACCNATVTGNGP